jgi:23S rRNA pseudouridine2605 synthase
VKHDADRTMRLHKFLAHAGAGSRRDCETLIAEGRVSVNGTPVTKMGVKVDPERDEVRLDGERVRLERRVYYLVHKPRHTYCTRADERGRTRVVDLVPEHRRIYTVGRLDGDSTGLILLTNDGDIANVICHPRYRIEKVYHVVVRGRVTSEQLHKLARGVWLAEGKASPARVVPLRHDPRRDQTRLEVTIFEGRNREIRRTFARVGLNVRRLTRVRIGPLELGDLPPGAYRPLEPRDLAFVGEAEQLYEANKTAWDAELGRGASPRKASGRARGRREPTAGRAQGARRDERRRTGRGKGGPRSARRRT